MASQISSKKKPFPLAGKLLTIMFFQKLFLNVINEDLIYYGLRFNIQNFFHHSLVHLDFAKSNNVTNKVSFRDSLGKSITDNLGNANCFQSNLLFLLMRFTDVTPWLVTRTP